MCVSGSERSVAGVTAMDNVMYCVGGFDGSSHLKDASMYDPRIDKWMGIANMSQPRYYRKISYVFFKIYSLKYRNLFCLLFFFTVIVSV